MPICINNNEVKVVCTKIYNFPTKEEDFNQFDTDELLSVFTFTGFGYPVKLGKIYNDYNRKVLIYKCDVCNVKVRHRIVIYTRNLNKILCKNCMTRPKRNYRLRDTYDNYVRDIERMNGKLIYTYLFNYSLDEYYQKHWYMVDLFLCTDMILVSDIKNVIVNYYFLLLYTLESNKK